MWNQYSDRVDAEVMFHIYSFPIWKDTSSTLKKFWFDLPEIVRDDACTYAQHLWKFLLETTKHTKGSRLARNKCLLRTSLNQAYDAW